MSVRCFSVLTLSLILPGSIDDEQGAQDPMEVARKRSHFLQVVEELSRRAPEGWSESQLLRRDFILSELARYGQGGQFPINTDHPGRAMPYFIDHFGTRCAVAQLMDLTGHPDLVLRIADQDNHAFLAELLGDVDIEAWLEEVGLSVEEAAYIQDPSFTRPGPTTKNILPPERNPDNPRSSTPGIDSVRGATGERGRAPSATTTPRRSTKAASAWSWQQWWDLNRHRFVDVRERYRSRPTTPVQPPTAESLLRDLEPFFAHQYRTQQDIRSTTLLAWARSNGNRRNDELEQFIGDYLRDSHQPYREFVLLALGFLGTDTAIPVLKNILQDRLEGRIHLGESGAIDDRFRSFAAVALAASGRTDVLADLRAVADRSDVSSELRLTALEVIGLCAREQAERATVVPALLKSLEASRSSTVNDRIQGAIPIALARCGDPAAVPELAGIVERFSGGRLLRQSCACALGALAPELNQDLFKLLVAAARRDPDPEVRQHAILTLGELAGRTRDLAGDLELEVMQFFADGIDGVHRQPLDQPFRHLAVALMARSHALDTTVFLDRLLDRAQNAGARDDRASAIVALGILADARAQPLLRAILDHCGDDMLRGFAAEALGLLGDREIAVTLLEACVESQSEWFSHRAAIALAMLAYPGLTEPLVQAFERTGSHAVQAALTSALGEIGDPRALEALRKVAAGAEQDQWTRRRATAAIGRIAEARDRSWTEPLREVFNPNVASNVLLEVADLF